MPLPRFVSRFGFAIAAILAALVGLELSRFAGPTLGEAFQGSWGRLVLTDLYLGLLIAAAWMWRRETRTLSRFGWVLAFLLLGNIGVGLYVAHAGRAATWEEFFMGAEVG